MQEAPIIAQIDFSRPFELECDASILGVGAVFSQGGHPMAYHSEKLILRKRNWITYDQELYFVVRACKVWELYLLHAEFVVQIDLMALKQLNNETTSNKMHARWVTYLQRIHFSTYQA